MRRWTRVVGVLLFLAWISLPAVIKAQATDPGRTLESFLRVGVDYEQQRLWQQAADVYERASKLYPDQPEIRERWYKAERLYSVSRRYHDSSFTSHLLCLESSDFDELYREVIGKILDYHVDRVSLDRLFEVSRKHFDIVLEDPDFWKRNGGSYRPDAVRQLRANLDELELARLTRIDEFVAQVQRVANVCEVHGLPSRAAVLLEFLTASCEGLDPYSAHLTPNRLRDLYAMIDGNFVGLGIEVQGDIKGLRIAHVLQGSPAEAGGIRTGDRIIAVDGRSLIGLPTEEAANQLQGTDGSTVRLTVLDGSGRERHLTLVRREVIVHSVTHRRMVDTQQGIGYIRLSSFQKLTVAELEEEVEALRATGMRSLILDLRGNPGGLLDVAVQVANHFLDRGVIVTTQGPAHGQTWSHEARPTGAWRFPLVILVDGNSASASEILAGALQDHSRATVVGSRSYGKGSVQSIFPLRTAGTGLRLTTARFFSPTGKRYEGVGVTPDLVLRRPIVGPLGEEAPVPEKVDLEQDVQLLAAVRLLINAEGKLAGDSSHRSANRTRVTTQLPIRE